MTKVTELRAETSATAAVATLSVAVAAAGHVVAGGTVSIQSLPQMLALAAIAWSAGEHVTGRRWLTVCVLAAIQLTTHLALEVGHRATSSIATAAAAPAAETTDGTAMDHAAMGHSSMHDMAGMAMPATDVSTGIGSGSLASAAESSGSMHSGLTDAVMMSAAHLLVLLSGVVLVAQAHRWVHRVAGILGRLVPQVPGSGVVLPVLRAVLVGVPEVPRLAQRWLVSSVSRRGPPEYGVLAASY
ncbi:MAG: hypothetical protein QOH03_3500 [Kribbellaceae bacterium]|jgi:hypothetical protein|nr:hypothetical protein [Kribbellaceae bacterium]